MNPKTSSQWFSRGLLVTVLLFVLAFSIIPAAAQLGAENYYDITFYAPGATDPETHEAWPSEGKVESVLVGTAIRFPQHPTRTGYRYMGWYTQPNGGGTLIEGDVHPDSDMALYAYFVPSYTITFNAPEAAGQGRIWPRHEEILPGESLIMPTDPFYAGHILVGWNTEADGSGEFVSADTVPTGNMDLYAIFREIRIYLARVEFYYEHNGQEITFGSESASFGLEALPYVYEDMPAYVSVQGIDDMLTPTVRKVTITEDDLTDAVYNEDKGLWEIPMSDKYRIKYVPADAEYTIVHMLKNLEGDSYTAFDSTTGYGLVGDEVLPDFRYDIPYAIPESRQSVLITQASGQEVPVYYTRADYVLRFNSTGGTPFDPVTAPYGSNISLSSYQPTRTGYTFAGWEDENGNAISSVTLNEETTVYARWNPAQVGYTVIYLFETYDDAGTTATFEYDNSERLTALTGATIHATDSFILDKSRTGWVRDDEQNAASSVVVEADGSSVLRVYYKLQDYTIRFRAGTLRGVYNNTQVRATYNGETTTGLFDYNLTVRLGQNIASVWPNGLTGVRNSNGSTVYFVGWQKENEGSIYATKRHYVTNEMLPATGTTVDYYGYWIQQAYSGTVTYWLQNANDDGYTRSEEYSESVNLTGTGSQMLSKEIVGFTYDHGNAETTYEDSGGVWDFYYNRNTYTIDYYDGDTLLDSKSGVKLDQNINTSEYNWTPTGQPGYTWDGWKNKNGENYNFGIMPPHNLVLYASWIAPEYTVSFDMNCGIAATPADFVDQTVEIMHNATRPASEPTRKYYTFTGWYTNPECSTGGTCTDPDAASCTVVFDFENTPITADTQLYAGWRLNTLSYTVHYVDEDGNTLLDDVVNTNPDFRPGQTVTETPWPIAGYTPNTTSITYTLGYEDNEITFVYVRNPEYKYYTVYYVLEENHDVHVHEPLEKQVPGERREAEQYIHSDFAIDRDYMVANGWGDYAYDSAGEIRYYPTYLKVSLPMLSMNPEENVMYFYFARYNSAHFTVNYLDMDGNKIADTEEDLVYVGDTYDVNKKHISGYTYYEHYDVTNGVWNPPEYDEIEGGENITINIYYKKTLDIYATDQQKMYDSTPLVSSFAEGDYTAIGLKDGHSITNLQFTGSQTDAGQSPTTPHDVTLEGSTAGRDYYIVNYHPGTLTVTRNSNPPVVITIDPDRWTGITYDGSTYSIGFTNPNKTLDDYVNINNEVYKNLYQQEIYNRILEDSLNREILISQKNAGTYTISPETIESWIGGLPGLNNFSSVTLEIRPCELGILPAPLTVTTGSAQGQYPDDAPLKNSTATLEGLVNGETATVTATGVREEIGSSVNTYEITWGTASENNYTITENLGELLLTGDVVIEVQDMTKVYNGLEQEGYGILNVSLTGDGSTIEQVKSITGLASGDVLTITAGHQKAKGTDVGEYTGTLDEDLVYTVRDRNGQDVTAAYEGITVIVGKLIITPATGLTVNAVDYEGVYDGNPHQGGGTANITEGTTYTYSTDGGTTWSSTIPSITDVGEVQYMVKASNKNYQDATDTGTLKVNPRPIVLKVQDRELPYNGSEQYGWDIDATITGNGGLVEREHYTMSGLLNGDVMYVADGDYTPSHGTEVGTYDNGAGEENPEFTILDRTGRDVTANYTPSAVAGKLTITTNTGEVILTAPSDSKTYDGTALTADGTGDKKVTASGLPDGFYVVAYARGSQTDAGSSANVVNTGWRIYNAAGRDVTASFTNVRTVDGTLTVNKRPLTISTGSDVKYYDGTPLTNDEKEVEGLVNGETVTVTTTGSQTEIGSSSNTYTLTWGSAKESNYTVTSNPGTLQVLANTATVVLTAPSGSKTYDGTALTIDGTGTRKVTATSLPSGFTVEATASGSQTDVGSSANVVNDGWIIRNAAGVDETASFTNVTKVEGTLRVNPKQVTITTGTANKEYDGTPLTNDEANITGLVNGETATVTATGSQTEVGSSSNTYSIDWGTTNKDNYTVSEQLGTLTVTENTAEVKLTAPSAAKVYDGTPLTCKGTADDNCGGTGPKTVTATGLPSSDFTVEATASGSKTHVGTGTGDNVVDAGWKIKDADGNDVTGYFTNVTTDKGTLTITPRPLTITTGSAEKEYDGTPLTKDEKTIDGLVQGETVTVTVNGSQTDVGESDNTYGITWDHAYQSDYTVTNQPGTLKVTSTDNEVVLTAPSDTKVYDGTALTAPGTTAKPVTWTGLPTGFRVEATATGSQTDAGSSGNVVNDGYKIFDTANNDVTSNYTNVRKVDGTLTVTPKEVTITTGSDSKKYDGKPLMKDEANITGLVNNETATVTATGSQTEVGSSSNTYSIDWGTTNKDNYSITENLGTLTVTENTAEVKLTAPSATKVYDGTALTAETPVTATGLPEGFTVEATAGSVNPKIHVGSEAAANIVNDGYKILNAAGEDKTANFTNVTKVNGTLTITPATLTITTGSDTKEYDGTPLTNSDHTETGLVQGESVTVTPNGSQTKVGSSDNTYNITWDNARLGDYTVSETLGTLTVTENTKAVKVIAPSAEKEYDGTALTAPGTAANPIKTENLPAGHRIQATIIGTQTDAGESANVIEDGWKILNGAGEDVTEYFTIKTKEDGTLKVTPKPLTITTDGAIKEYDGTPLTNENIEVEGLVDGETIEAKAIGSQTEVGSSDNTYSIDWGTTNKDNYKIVENLGLLRVIEFTGEIALRAASTQKTYDGTPLTRDEVIPSGLPEGFTVEAHAAGSQTDAGSTENVVQDGWIIRDKDGNDKTADFVNVTKVNGTLTVNPKDLTITSGSASKVYDGTPLTNPDYTVSGLVGDETLTVTVTGSRTTVGSGENTFEVTWDNAKESNYTLTENPGTLTVTPYERAVVLTAPSAEKVYDGTPLTKDGTDPEYPLIISGLPEGFRVETVIEGSATNVGDDGTNTITSYRIIRTENGADRTEFFTNVTLVDGNLTILPRPVTVNVTGNNDRVLYDRGEHSVEGYTMEISDPLYTEEYIDFEGEAKVSGTNVGNYEMGLSEDRFGNNNNNFEVTFSVNDGWLRIDPKSVTVVIAGIDVEKVYNGEEQTALEYEIVSISDDWVTEDEILLIPDRAGASGTEAGQYPMRLAGENAPFECTDTNFDVEFIVTEGYLIITPLEVTVVVDDDEKFYGDPDPEYDYDIPDLPDDVPPDVITCTFTREEGEDVTEEGYTVTPECGSDDDSFIVDIEPGKLIIKPRPITITAASDSKVYDGTPLTNAGYEITEGTLAFDDVLASAVVTGSQTDAGSSENTVSDALINGADGADVTENYEITYVPGTLTVERKKITVTPEHQEKIEGQPDPELTVIIDGLVPGDPEDIIDYTIDREPGEKPGDYPIHVDGDPEQGNYIVEFEPGIITIHKNVSPVDITVEVGWDDRNDVEGIRPATTTVYLYGNGELFGTVELGPNGYAVQKTIDETWSYTFVNMPRVDMNLDDIVYTVEEQRTDVLTGVDGPGTYAITEEEVEPYHFFITNTHTVPDVEFTVRKSWVGGESEHEPVTIQLLANGEPTEYTLVLSAENQWAGSFTGLPKYDEDTRELLTYTVMEPESGDYDPLVRGNQESGFTVVNYQKPVVPELFDFDIEELPATGITTPKSQLRSKPASIRYEPTSLLLQIPTLNVSAGIVTVPFEDGSFPVEFLGMDAGLLEGSDKPGEGISVLAAHNTVNAEEIGPFVTIMKLREGDRIFVTNEEGEVMIYEVYANAKIGANDMDGLEQYAAAYYNTLTLLTCEDERVEGGYASRRIVSARRVN